MPTATWLRPYLSERFKSFSVEQDQALNVIRYVERNALRANLVDKA
jgi:hypothetical protein